ncbi:hypothetical protein [Streptomyces sp. NPDC056672]
MDNSRPPSRILVAMAVGSASAWPHVHGRPRSESTGTVDTGTVEV